MATGSELRGGVFCQLEDERGVEDSGRYPRPRARRVSGSERRHHGR